MISSLTKERFNLSQLLFLIVLLLSGCSKLTRPKSVTVDSVEIAPQPPQIGPITLTFQLKDAAIPVTGARISLEADMTHAGMAPVFGSAQETTPGRYRGRLDLAMGGDWVVLLHITSPNGKKWENQIDVRGVKSK